MARQTAREYGGRLILALTIGALAGLGAMLFRALIMVGQDILWPAGNTFVEQLQHADWWLIVLIPAGMGLLAGPIISFWAPEIKGPGVPEVMESLALRDGRIRHRVTLIKSLVTAGLIAAGNSLGREGPIVQIGSSIGSSLCQLFHLDANTRRLAIACGAAAGIAATFQAPMAGTLFAVEVLLFDLEVTSLSTIIIAAVTGTLTARGLLGVTPVFIVPSFSLGHPMELFLYFGLGIVAGLVSLVLMGVIFNLPKLWPRLKIAEWLSPAMGGLMVSGTTLAPITAILTIFEFTYTYDVILPLMI